MVIPMTEYTRSTVLAGALDGKLALNWMLTKTISEPHHPELAILDFTGIEVATASFLRESVLAFRDIVRGRRSQYYPIVANITDVVRDEFIELLRARGGALMGCNASVHGEIRDFVPLGELDPKQRHTFDLIQKHGETDAGRLMRKYGEREGLKHTTAWNNRLAGLSAMGLIVERNQGRAKRYGPLTDRNKGNGR